MITVRSIDPYAEQALLIEAWHWRDESPDWFRACYEIWKETFEEYLAASYDELHIGVWDDGVLTAVVRMIPEKKGFFALHLSAKHGTNPDNLTAACLQIKEMMFDHGVQFYGYLPTIHRSVAKIYEALGFWDTGIRIYKGIVKGKLICWRHYLIINDRCAAAV